jgi:disulfide bond formation protein DsbB
MRPIYYLYFSLTCLGLLGAALWLQHYGYSGINFAPCPLCILQRIGYLGIASACLLAFLFKPLRRLLHLAAIGFGLFGLIVAGRQIWVIIHPTVSCGLDPLEVFINQFGLTQSAPWFFKADGFCSAPLPPLLGLSVPVWSLIWFSILLSSLIITLLISTTKRQLRK